MPGLLIVDDEAPIVLWLEKLFRAERPELSVYSAFSGDEALRCLSCHPIDVVLSDIRMPGMDGLKLLAAVRERHPNCRVVFLTAHDRFDYAVGALRGQSVDYLLKTEDDAAIVAAVRRALALSAAPSAQAIPIAEEEPYLTLRTCLFSDWHDAYLMRLEALLAPIVRTRTGDDHLEVLLKVISQLAEYARERKLLDTGEREETIKGLLSVAQGGHYGDAARGALGFAGEVSALARGRALAKAAGAVARVAAYIDANPGGDLSIMALSRLSRLNPSYLSRLFSQSRGCTLSEYILDARMERAKRLLELTELHSYEIGELVGYISSAAFHRVFKRNQGLTPQEYRARFAGFTGASRHDI